MRMDNATYWAIKLREREAREMLDETRTNARRARVADRPSVIPAAEPMAEPTYRELQAKAKELEIPGNQSAEDLKAAIEDAEA